MEFGRCYRKSITHEIESALIVMLFKMRCGVVRELMENDIYVCDETIDKAIDEKIRGN